MFLFSLNHSLIYGNVLELSDWVYEKEKNSLRKNYNRPLVLDAYKRILTGLTTQATQKVDMLFTQTVSLGNTINM